MAILGVVYPDLSHGAKQTVESATENHTESAREIAKSWSLKAVTKLIPQISINTCEFLAVKNYAKSLILLSIGIHKLSTES